MERRKKRTNRINSTQEHRETKFKFRFSRSYSYIFFECIRDGSFKHLHVQYLDVRVTAPARHSFYILCIHSLFFVSGSQCFIIRYFSILFRRKIYYKFVMQQLKQHNHYFLNNRWTWGQYIFCCCCRSFVMSLKEPHMNKGKNQKVTNSKWYGNKKLFMSRWLLIGFHE